jgi:hypothetical protein
MLMRTAPCWGITQRRMSNLWTWRKAASPPPPARVVLSVIAGFRRHIIPQKNAVLESTLCSIRTQNRNDIEGTPWQCGGIGSTHSQPSTRRWVVSTTLRPIYPRKRPVRHCTGDWVGFGASLDDTENLAPTGIRYLDRPARCESLYRLQYLGHQEVPQ